MLLAENHGSMLRHYLLWGVEKYKRITLNGFLLWKITSSKVKIAFSLSNEKLYKESNYLGTIFCSYCILHSLNILCHIRYTFIVKSQPS